MASLTSPISSVSRSVALQPTWDKTTVSLEAIRDARGDINEIRMLLKGKTITCHNLFQQAVEKGDVILQIQLSHALFGMQWGKDHAKDFSLLLAKNLEIFSYYPREFALFDSAYEEAMGVEGIELDRRTADIRNTETFLLAASRGYLPAFLELKCKEWRWHTTSYGFAVQLRPFVGKGDRVLDHYFGHALKSGSQVGSELYYEGLYWITQSDGISVKYPKKDESFENFIKRYVEVEDRASSFHDHDGFRYVGDSAVLAPSREAWEAFIKQKLADIRIAPLDSYLFAYDPNQIKDLLNKHKIVTVPNSSFVQSSSEGRDVEDFFGKKTHGFWIAYLLIYQNGKNIGQISVQENTFKIHQTFKNSELQPIIDFIENVMTRTGSAGSAYSWLRQIGD